MEQSPIPLGGGASEAPPPIGDRVKTQILLMFICLNYPSSVFQINIFCLSDINLGDKNFQLRQFSEGSGVNKENRCLGNKDAKNSDKEINDMMF